MKTLVISGLLTVFCLFNTIRPWTKGPEDSPSIRTDHASWPSRFMGEKLSPIPLSDAEEAFYKDFPGEAAQFVVGAERLILRRVNQATRKLHPARDCFRGMGFSIQEEGLKRDPFERVWRTFTAEKPGQQLRVFEMISDEAGNTWSDVSAWYWAVLSGKTEAPWLSYVRIMDLDPVPHP